MMPPKNQRLEMNHLRQLGKTDLLITPLGFGSWALGGGGWRFGWGPQDDRESVAAIQRALDLGVNWIDTAAAYGLGHSEEIVAQALKNRRERPLIFTKCSMPWDGQGNLQRSLKAGSVRVELEDSLRRLRVDTIDLYQVHWPIPDEQIEEGWATLAELKRQGKVRYIGASNFSVEQLRRAGSIAPVDALQPPYSLIRREIEQEILPYCQEQGIGVIVYSPMASGLLSGGMDRARIESLPADDWRRNSSQFQEPKLSKNLRIADRLKEIGQRRNCSAGEVAIAWTLRHPAVTAAIVGARTPAQVDGFIDAMGFRLSQAEVDEIEIFLRS
jgi:aryl-alcohol dehydrogenase-like predicted oxidoreductase